MSTVLPYSDEYFMRQALAEAALAYEAGEVPIGAVVVCRGQIIARAHNEVERLSDPTAHAEVLAVTAATEYMGSKFLPDCQLYVTVEPCVMCAGALAWAQVGRIVYGAADPKRGYSVYAPEALHPRTQVTAGVLAEECGELMRQFFKSKR